MFALSLTSAIGVASDANNHKIDECIFRLADNDMSAMEELYSLTSSSVYSFALSVLRNRHDAEDVLHDLYVSVYSAAPSYRSAGKPMAWMITVAKNLALKKLRERKKNAEISPEESEYGSEIFSGMSMEDGVVISACLNELSEEERQIVVLHAVSGFKHREIASVMRLPISTVLSKYNRALKKLQKILEGEKT